MVAQVSAANFMTEGTQEYWEGSRLT